MPRRLQLDVSADQQHEPEQVRDHHRQPSRREKAALLKIAARAKGGGGASPLFPPAYPDAPQAKTALLLVLHTSPEACGFPQSRWTLAH